jgi:hypothetical protein
MASKLVRMKLKVQDIIDSQDRFPESRNEGSNVLKKQFVNRVNRGEDAVPWGCPVILDVTGFDEYGDPLSPEDIVEQGLAYKMVFIETMPDGSIREQHGPRHDGSKYNSCHGFGTRMPAYEDLGGGLVTVEAKLGELSAKHSYRVS